MRRVLAAVFFSLVVVSPHSGAQCAEVPLQTVYSKSDVAQLVQAVIGIPTNQAFLMGLQISPAAKLPAWDPVAHYAGPQSLPDGRTAYFVLVNEKYAATLHDVAHADHSVAAAIASAVFLAAMDGGIAGTKWKSFYDAAAAADARLPSDATDRYANRHVLADHLADTQTTVYPSLGDAPIGDSAGYPLTEKLAYGSDSLGLARLGVGAARMLELSENGDAMKQQAAQNFEDDWFTSFRSVLPTDDGRLALDGLRQFLRPDTPADHVSDQDHFVAGMIKLVNALPSDTRAPFFVGLQVSETRYNATVIRHVDEDTALRAALADSPSLDSTLPALVGLRDRLAAVPAGDWATITSISNQIIKSIVDGT